MAYKPFALSLIGTIPIDLTSLDAGAAAGPIVDNYRNSASPAASDILGGQIFYGKDSAANKQEYARYETRIIDTTSTAEKGAWALYTTSAGTATKQIDALDTGCQIRGNNTNTAPPAGYVGEQITSSLPVGSATSLTTATGKTVTSISLTPGIWDVSCIGVLSGTLTGLQFEVTISAVDNTTATNYGVDSVSSPTMPTVTTDTSLCIPKLRITLSATTTYYLVVRANFSAGTATSYGSITATRVG